MPAFERISSSDGILLFKYWLSCDQDKQEQRFANRLNNPMKRWKLSPIDIKARNHYDDYTEARERMLKATHTEFAPWTMVDFDDQQIGRLTLLRDFLDRVPDTKLPLARNRLAASCQAPPSKDKFGVLEPLPKFPDPRSTKRDMIYSLANRANRRIVRPRHRGG